jgi:uncharacterized membrane protein YphA (DoxX/SURF4 family)
MMSRSPYMQILTTVGRWFLALAVMAFGIEHLVYATSGAGLGAPWSPEDHLLAYVAGIVFLAAGVSLATGKQARLTAWIMAILFLARAALFYAPRVAAAPRDPGPWTSAFELLAMCGASLILATSLTRKSSQRGNRPGLSFQLGRVLFSAPLVVFGVQHLLYGPFIARLIPLWIPGRLFWAYFVGVAFIAAALAIVAGKLAVLAATLLGTMFLLWVLMLHGPRVAGAMRNGDEWTSLFVALALSGAAFVIAGVSRRPFRRNRP